MKISSGTILFLLIAVLVIIMAIKGVESDASFITLVLVTIGTFLTYLKFSSKVKTDEERRLKQALPNSTYRRNTSEMFRKVSMTMTSPDRISPKDMDEMLLKIRDQINKFIEVGF